uniref:Topo IIA-type catalytic domain-containing protein n=1 Tax=Cairina moschata TaxID=8855 RepID=A0A8C3C6B9_CAIMO
MDDNVLKFLYDDNQRVEPEWYIPIIPMVLINGAEGIGTGWSCKIPNFDIRETVNNIRRLMDGEEPLPMLPSYKNFKGTIDELGPNQYVISGEVSILDSTTIEITELPVRTWTQTYKEQVLEPMLNGTEKTPPLITDYKEYHTDTTVKFVVKMSEEKLAEAEAVGLHKVFKLQTNLTCNSMVLFDHVGFLKKYESPQDILKEFFELRLRYYGLRKEWLIGMLGAESAKLSNQARFILEKIDGKIVIGTHCSWKMLGRGPSSIEH